MDLSVVMVVGNDRVQHKWNGEGHTYLKVPGYSEGRMQAIANMTTNL